MATVGQLAAVRSAPRFSSSLRSKSVSLIVCCLERLRPEWIPEPPDTMLITWRLARAGLIAALVVGLAGWGYGRVRFGATDQDALSRIEAELRERLDTSAATLGAMATRIAAERDVVQRAPRDQTRLRQLFDAVDAAL